MLTPEFLLAFKNCDVIDISQDISTTSACFPGDTPFSFEVTMSYQESKIANVTALTMSPHVGTHADAPNHIEGDVSRFDEYETSRSIGRVALKPYIGPVTVIDLTSIDGDFAGAITQANCLVSGDNSAGLHERVLFKTRTQRRGRAPGRYSYFNKSAIDFLAAQCVSLVGIDTPSVDAMDSETLGVHQLLLKKEMYWLENLDLSGVAAGEYVLVALPLKFTELEASPVRAVLLKARSTAA